MQSGANHGRRRWAALVVAALLVLGAQVTFAEDFDDKLARVDQALRKNRSHAAVPVLNSCRNRRNAAVKLNRMRLYARAERSLSYCMNVLKIPDVAPNVEASRKPVPTIEEFEAQAARELEKALALTPDLTSGLEIYRACAMCHMGEGWGLSNGSVPQIAGQHRKVVIKQLADIRAGNRDSVLMAPYSSVESIGGPQAVANVAGYIDTLEMSPDTGKGPGTDLALGSRLYKENCARCHGDSGEGDGDTFVPRIQSQHYNYLLKQFEWIRDGKRRNANAEMVAQIQDLDDRAIHAMLDYVSRIEPPVEFVAPEGWRNPDFAE
jgi:cytochrome c553